MKTLTDRELMQQALDALSGAVPSGYIKDRVDKHYQVMEALRARLAQCDAGEICIGCRVCPDAQPEPAANDTARSAWRKRLIDPGY